ncbi:MAG: 50S ribosomal protein L18 [Parcubacteria group bacterium]|nr:50S ribosomal protein L18 [Parcubacteria group bacterium]
MMKTQQKQLNAARRANRVRRTIRTHATGVRVSLFVSLRGVFAQVIDDFSGRTLVSGRDKGLTGNKTERAAALGEQLGKKALEAGIAKMVFDRGPKQYHGRVRAFAEGLRRAGVTI